MLHSYLEPSQIASSNQALNVAGEKLFSLYQPGVHEWRHVFQLLTFLIPATLITPNVVL